MYGQALMAGTQIMVERPQADKIINAATFVKIITDMEFVQNFTPPDFQTKNFTPSISPNFNSFSKKKHKKWVKKEKFTLLAKILQCRRQWRHGQIPPLDHQDFQDQYHQDQQIVCCYLCCPPCAVWERTSDGEVPWFQTFSFRAGRQILSTIPPIILSFCLSFDFWQTWQRLTEWRWKLDSPTPPLKFLPWGFSTCQRRSPRDSSRLHCSPCNQSTARCRRAPDLWKNLKSTF